MIQIKEKIAQVLDLIWPRTCAICNGVVDRESSHICSNCVNRLPFVPTEGCCSICGRSVDGLKTEYLCDDCRGVNRPFFDRAGSALRFEGDARDLLLGYKFNRKIWLKEDLSSWLIAATRARFNVDAVDLVIPMPMTLYHRLDRGYNQCVYLAQSLAKDIDRKYDGNILKRAGRPKRQSELSEDERRENAKGTFKVKHSERVRGRTVLIVDDIMTTGATLSECASTLKKAGAWRVWGMTVARSLREL